MPRITIQMFEGRTQDQKRAICKRITQVMCEEAGVKPDAVTIVIDEMSKGNYAKAGVMKCDM